MPSYIFLSILAAFSFSIGQIINKFTSIHKISNPWVLLFYYYIGLLPWLFLIPFIFKIRIPQKGLEFIFLYAIFFYSGTVLFNKAIYKLDISSISPFFQLQSAFIAILAYIFLAERFSVLKYIFIALMLMGTIFVTYNEKFKFRSFLKFGVLLIISMQLLHALSNIFAGFALKHTDSFSFIFFGDLVASFIAFTTIPFFTPNLLKVKFSQIKPLFFSGFFSMLGATSLFSAFMTNVTISSALSLLTSPIVLTLCALASFFKPSLLEHHTKKVYLVRAVGIVLVLISAFGLKFY